MKRKKIMSAVTANVACVFLVLLLFSCDVIENSIGPPLPKSGAMAYLKASGYSSDLICRVTSLEEIDINKFEELSVSTNVFVRYLIAENPFTPNEVFKRLMSDDNEFVRQGAALSRSISVEQALILSRDSSYRVQGALVANPSVQESLILELRHRNKKIPLSDFAMNVNCPLKIRQEIMKSNDSFAKSWLSQKWSAEHTNAVPARISLSAVKITSEGSSHRSGNQDVNVMERK